MTGAVACMSRGVEASPGQRAQRTAERRIRRKTFAIQHCRGRTRNTLRSSSSPSQDAEGSGRQHALAQLHAAGAVIFALSWGAVQARAADRSTSGIGNSCHRVAGLTAATRDAMQKWIRQAALKSEDVLFPSRLHDSPHVGIRQYARILGSWVDELGLDPANYGTLLDATDQGDAHLSAHQESACRSVAAWALQAGVHREIPRNRGGRRLGDRRADGKSERAWLLYRRS